MSRTALQKAESVDGGVLRSGSRLRHRALALLHGAMVATGTSKAELAALLGLGRSAVGQTLNGNGNLTLQTLAEYLAVMDVEVELVPVARGEIVASMRERRPPHIEQLTLRDRDWAAVAGVHVVTERRSERAKGMRSVRRGSSPAGVQSKSSSSMIQSKIVDSDRSQPTSVEWSP